MSERLKLLPVILILLALCGCSSFLSVDEVGEGGARVELPEPGETAPPAPIGDARDDEIYRATLYYLSADKQSLMPFTRVIMLPGNASMEEKLAEEALRAPAVSDILAFAPDFTRLAYAERAMGEVTVNLKPGGYLAGDDAQARVAAAMASTLNGIEGVEYVNVLWAGRAMSCAQLPIGALSADSCDLQYVKARAAEDSARLLSAGEGGARITRAVTLYYPCAGGRYVAPETRDITFENADYAARLVEALGEAPQSAGAIKSTPIKNALAGGCEYALADDGARVIDIRYTQQAFQALAESGADRYQFLASLTLTVTTFCPDIDGVRVFMGEHMVTDVAGPGSKVVHFEAGVLRRSAFEGEIGELIPLYFANDEGMLRAEARAVRASEARSLRARIALLMAGPTTAGLSPTFPAGLDASDILGVYVKDGVARVNLSSEFYRRCQALNEESEALLMDSLANTLSVDARVRGVYLFIDGDAADTLAGNIWLRGVYLPNPGRL